MLSALLRLFALRPLLTLTLFGIPILILVVVGLLTIWALKLFIFIVLPIGLIFFLVRRMNRGNGNGT
ncbi:MAG TPA: hypothetical protein VJ672_00190 [Gemmatimonadaceae bacterium]|nr:hypothetical protein [Gemmatimonadaceae bacterium]